ncbi:Histidine kinase-, DNA gyrase B-, and HSP90-like ATPase [Blastococcus fimeti]|nr:Histidine kinase-, DNA gyrase B-, and HSP90-like ATPase [Blastococcus fimeti]
MAGEATSGRITPAQLAASFAERTAAGTLTPDDAKDHFRSLDALAQDGAPMADCLAALDAMLDDARATDSLGRGLLIISANVRALYGDVEEAAATMIAAYRSRPEGFTAGHPTLAVRRLRSFGPDAAVGFLTELRAAGVPVDLERQSAVVVGPLESAQSTAELTDAIATLAETGGLPDVVAAGRALSVLRGAPGRTAEHAVSLFRLARETCPLTPRMLNDALTVLAELGAADESAMLLEEARSGGLEPGALHRVTHMQALNNALRYEESLGAYREYLAAGHPANVRARRTHLTALCWNEQPDEARVALLDWADAVRVGSVEAPAPALLTSVLNALAQDDTGDLVDAVERTTDAFEWNEHHRKLVLGVTSRSRALVDHARALAALSTVRRPTRHELENLLRLAVDRHVDDVISALTRVCDAVPRTAAILGGTLAAAQLERGALAAAEETARTSRAPEAIEAVTYAHLAAGDIDAALRTARMFDPEDDGPRPRPGPMPHPPALVGRMVRALAARRGTPEAEEWLRGYAVRGWPATAWEGLASAYRRGKGNVSAIERLMTRMRRVGIRPTGDVWAHALYALPRAKRADRVAEALTAMRADRVQPTAAFFTAAIVGALQPAKVHVPDGGDVESVAWAHARTAIADGEALLAQAVTELEAPTGDPARTPERWFSAAQLLEIARSYPLSRRPYAQVDAAVEVRLAEETEPAEQFGAFLGAVAAAHARALLPEGVERLRAVAARVGEADRPELAEALLDSLADDPGAAVRAVLAENDRRLLAADVVADAAGRALARTGDAGTVERVLVTAEPPLPEEQAERLVSAAVLEFEDAGRMEDARRIGTLAEGRGLDLSPGAQGALIATHRPADPLATEDQGPVWTTAQLAAFNGLLHHEIANQLQVSRSRTRLLGSALASLRENLPPEVAERVADSLTKLARVQQALFDVQDEQQSTIDKIVAAADQERASAGVVPVLDAMTVVAQQMAGAAEAARTGIRVVNGEECARLHVRGHATLLQFALHNLISNGIKAHTRAKDELRREIELFATFAESAREDLGVAPYGWVIVSVRDHGDGVPDDLPDNVANWSMPGQPGLGAGIGLSRTENMIRLSGGELWVDQSVTEGSRFCFRLPSAARRQARGAQSTTREDPSRD